MNAVVTAVAERLVRVGSAALGSVLVLGGATLTSMPWGTAVDVACGAMVLELVFSLAAGTRSPVGPGLTETVSRERVRE